MIAARQFASLVNASGVIEGNQRRIIPADIDTINAALGTNYTEVKYESLGYSIGDTIPDFDRYFEIV